MSEDLNEIAQINADLADEAQAKLDRAWADINALGGVPNGPEEEAYGRALDDCMAILERLGATDKVWLAEFKTAAQTQPA